MVCYVATCVQLGLTPGAAWQAAMQAATEVGCQQVMLIDRPTVVTERKLTDALVAQTGGPGHAWSGRAGLLAGSEVVGCACMFLTLCSNAGCHGILIEQWWLMA